MILSSAVILAACYFLRGILIKFVLALALRYLLLPLVDLLSCNGLTCRLRLPRTAAILVALLLAAGLLGLVVAVVVRSIGSFAEHSDAYGERVNTLLQAAANVTGGLIEDLLPIDLDGSRSDVTHALLQVARHVDLSYLLMTD